MARIAGVNIPQNKLVKADYQWLHFFDNAVVLINKNFKPLGNRVFGPVLKSLRQMKSFKLVSISSGLVSTLTPKSCKDIGASSCLKLLRVLSLHTQIHLIFHL